MSMMKTNLRTIPMCPRERFALYKSFSRLVLFYKKDWATLLHLATFVTCYPLRITLSQNYLLPIISVLADNTLLKAACHSFCSSLGSTLLLIERTTIDPLYLWFVKAIFWLPVTIYPITKLSITDNFSACREYLAENHMSFPSSPRWVRHSYLLKGLR